MKYSEVVEESDAKETHLINVYIPEVTDWEVIRNDSCKSSSHIDRHSEMTTKGKDGPSEISQYVDWNAVLTAYQDYQRTLGIHHTVMENMFLLPCRYEYFKM